MAEAAADEMAAATDIADLLVRRGMPFREAHGVVGGLVRHALEQRHRALRDPGRASSASFSELLDDEYYEVLAEGAWLDSKVSRGGTSADAVERQLELAAESLGSPAADERRPDRGRARFGEPLEASFFERPPRTSPAT